MKCQPLVSRKSKKNITNLPSADFARSMLMVKVCIEMTTILYMRKIELKQNIQNKFFQDITKTYLYNFDPLKPHFYIVKLGFTRVYIIFLISAQNIACGYSLEPPQIVGTR